jgi:hypothetical protein
MAGGRGFRESRSGVGVQERGGWRVMVGKGKQKQDLFGGQQAVTEIGRSGHSFGSGSAMAAARNEGGTMDASE